MSTKLVSMAMIGRNRVGFVSEFTKFIYDKGANIHKSRMIGYQNDFIITFNAEFPESLDQKKIIHKFENEILPINTESIYKLNNLEKKNNVECYKANIAISLADTPGIIHKTTSVLASENINIDELRSDREIAGFSNTPLFKLDLEVSIPNSKDISKIYNSLNLNGELNGITLINKL